VNLDKLFVRAACGQRFWSAISAPGSVCSDGSYNQPMSPDKLSDVAMEEMTAENWSAVRALVFDEAASGEAAGVA
ncbi:MAG: hypothetical protein ACHP79_06775, partial [Terriglobales bacterium]